MALPKGSSPWVWVLAITGLGIALRAFRLSNPALWLDESTTFTFASEPLARVLGKDYLAETNPPLYYLLQRAWLVFGDTREAMRSLPLLLGALVIPLTFVLARILVGVTPALMAAALVATSELQLSTSREIRAYPLLTSAALAALACLAKLLVRERVIVPPHESSQAAPSPAPDGAGASGFWTWCGYVAATSVALYSHSSAVLLPALATFLVLGGVATRVLTPQFLWRWVLANALVLVLYAPWAGITALQSRTVLTDFWIPKPTFGWVASSLMGAYPFPGWLKPILYSLPIAGVWLLRKKPLVLAFLLVVVVGQPVLLYLASLYRPVFLTRVLIWPTPLTFILMSVAIANLATRLGRAGAPVLTALVAAGQMLTIGPMFPRARQESDFAALLGPLRGFDRDRDALVIAPIELAWEFRYETRDFGLPRHGFGLSVGDKRPQLDGWFGVTRVQRRDVVKRLSSHRAAWFLREVRSLSPPAPGDGFEEVFSELEAWGQKEQSWVAGTVELSKFQRHAETSRAR